MQKGRISISTKRKKSSAGRKGRRKEGRKGRKTARRRPDSCSVSVLPSWLPRLHSSARFNLPAARRQFNLQPNTLLCLTRGAPTFNYTFRSRVERHQGVCERVANTSRVPKTATAADNHLESMGEIRSFSTPPGSQWIAPCLCFNRPPSSVPLQPSCTRGSSRYLESFEYSSMHIYFF